MTEKKFAKLNHIAYKKYEQNKISKEELYKNFRKIDKLMKENAKK